MPAPSEGSALLQRRSLKGSLICACWTFIAVFYTSQAALQASYAGVPFDWWHVLRAELIYALLWIVLTFAVIRLDRRFPLDRGSWRSSLAVHLAAGALVSIIHPPALVWIMRSLGWGHTPAPPFWDVAKQSIAGSFHVNLTFYWGILGVRYILANYRKYRERELAASQLEARLAQSRLQVLKMQLHPHFLFNTLNTISILMSEDTAAAKRTLVRLSDLLRMTLDNGSAQETSLKNEMDFLQGYLDIERTRFNDRLT